MKSNPVPKPREKPYFTKRDRKLQELSTTWITLGAYGLFESYPGLESAMMKLLVKEMEEAA